ncbi:DNA replication complex GINS protein PSF1 [Spinellus fusiger]|nr:DNA replication complex GINS protein PSF1 [Spinellus fusiger]
MSIFCESSQKLAKEAKRTADLLVSPYNEDLVQVICREVRLSQGKADAVMAIMQQRSDPQAPPEPDHIAQLLLQYMAIKRNKRVLFSYHRQRMEKLKELSWNVGLQSEYQRDIKSSLGPNEHRFLEDYTEIVNNYKHNFPELDLGGNGGVDLAPPTDLIIEVRVIKDGGEVMTESGSVLNISKGNQFYVRRTDVEGLIKSGYLKHVH